MPDNNRTVEYDAGSVDEKTEIQITRELDLDKVEQALEEFEDASKKLMATTQNGREHKSVLSPKNAKTSVLEQNTQEVSKSNEKA